jgi:predicted SAM-dependent methyltransferase
VQYGCGLVAPPEWTNFDASPTLKIQKMPLIGVVMKRQLNTVFPRNVLCGDIVKGLPVNENSCDGLYCSHVLEHLSLNDFRKALTNSYRILKKGGIFRLVVPDLEIEARSYIRELDRNNPSSSVKFIGSTLIGTVERPRGIRGITEHIFGNSRHLWMWDTQSITHELQNTGFTGIRNCMFGDCTDKMFEKVENADRFNFCVAIECTK